MSVGNTDVDVDVSNLAWFQLLLGVCSRPKTTSVPKAIYGVLFDPQFEHYEAK